MAIHQHHSRARTVSHSGRMEQHVLSASVLALAVLTALLAIAG